MRSRRARARTKRPTACAKKSSVEVKVASRPTAGGHVDALGHHAHGDRPALGARAEVLDALARAKVVGENDHRGLARRLTKDGGIRPRLDLVRGDRRASARPPRAGGPR